MKPIQLTFSGIQSYRETQRIDFTSLCEAGVFGIFGPTGSGKSTILDAMTLALYGKVERAANGTQGILNHAENTLSVSYTFELSNGKLQEMYRVERQYKRTNDVSISSSISRLIQISTQGEMVLADKQGDVNRLVEELLGLSMQDFTRAVVLPQGKFAEFLSLKGSDRRQMLQRLFHLEPYGDLLQLKVSSKVKENNIRIKQLEAEQQGLGQASEEDVKTAEALLGEADREAMKVKTKLRTLEEEAARNKQIVEKQQELQQTKASLEELGQKTESITALEQMLAVLDHAARLKPYLNQLEKAILERDKASGILLESKKHYETIQEQFNTQYKAHQEADAFLAQHEENARQKINTYKQAMDTEKQLIELKQHAKEAKLEAEKAEQQLKKLEEQLTQENSTLAKAVSKQDILRKELLTLEVRNEERRKIQSALEQKRTIDTQQKQIDRVTVEHLKKAAEARKLEESLSTLDRSSGVLQQQMGIHWQACTSLKTDLKLLEEKAYALEADLTTEESRHREEAKRNELDHYASLLADQLKEGQACPVCGSDHHNSPKHETPQNVPLEHNTVTEAAFYSTRKEIQTITHKLKEGMLQIDARLHQVEAVLFNQAMQEAAAGSEDLGAVTTESVQSHNDFQDILKALDGLNQKSADHLSQIDRLTADLKQAHEAYQTHHTSIQEMKIHWKTLQPVISEQEAELNSLNNEKKQCIQKYTEMYRELALDDIEEAWKQLEQRDMQTENIKARLERSIPFIEKIEAQIQQLKEQYSQTDKLLFEWKTRAANEQKLSDDLEKDLIAKVGRESAEALYHQSVEQLNSWKKNEQQLNSQLEETRKLQEQALKQYSASEQASLSANEQLFAAEKQWESEIESSPIKSFEEIKAMVDLLAHRQDWELEVKQFREEERLLLHKKDQLMTWLSGRQVNASDYTELLKNLDEVKQTAEHLVSKKAKAERDLEELTRKHKRWVELEQDTEALKELHRQLTQLQTVFRGNAFVEYLAEEELMQVSRSASHRLGQLTRQRYAIEVDSSGGFVIRDDANGGVKRPVSSLSGGETFLTSLALALALSTEIQLRGKYPLQFFFLDEGFGTLDPELLDMVITALERLHMDHLAVGVISHVPELRSRLPRKLIVTSSEPSGRGSQISPELL
jgi:exonuclease SbcC